MAAAAPVTTILYRPAVVSAEKSKGCTNPNALLQPPADAGTVAVNAGVFVATFTTENVPPAPSTLDIRKASFGDPER